VSHGFRSATSIVAFCGHVDRSPRPRTEGEPPPDACPACLAVYRNLTSSPKED
jgi:hypothetical protein